MSLLLQPGILSQSLGPVTQYFDDFDADGEATDNGWTKTLGGAGFDATVSGSILSIAAVAANDMRFLSWDALNADANRDQIELVARVRFSDTSLLNGVLAARMEPDFTGYTLDNRNNGTAEIRRFNSGSSTGLASKSYGWGAGWNRARLRVNGSDLKIKVWGDADAEPAAWTLETTDATYADAGLNGIFSFSPDVVVEVDWIGAGTNGDTAPMEAV